MIYFMRWSGWISRICGGLVLALGVLVLAGWLMDLPVLLGVRQGWPRMSPLTALLFVLSGGVLWIAPKGRSALIDACAGAVAAIGMLRLVLYFSGIESNIDQLGFHPASGLTNPVPARTSPATAFAFAVAGVALLMGVRMRFPGLVQLSGAVAGVLGWIGIGAYFYGGEPLFPFAQMAFPSAFGILLLSVGVLCMRKDWGMDALLLSDTAGGRTARQLALPTLFAPFLLGWFYLLGQRSGLYGAEAGTMLFSVSLVLVFGTLIVANARALDRTDAVRQAAERALSENEHLLQSIINNSTAVIYVKDLDGRYLAINKQYEELFKISQAELLGKTDYDLFAKDQADAYRAVDRAVADQGKVIEAEETAPLEDGPHTYISIKFPLRDQTGRIYAVGGISTDISERKRSELALRESEERTRLIVDTALDAVITMDAGGVVTGWNTRATETFGWAANEAIGRRLRDMIIPHGLREAHESGLKRYLETGKAAVLGRRIELTALHRDGREFPVELAIARIPLGRQACFSAFVRDITSRREAEHKLQQQLERLDLLSRVTQAIGERQDLPSIFQVLVRSLEDQMPIDFGCVCLSDPARETLSVASLGAKSQSYAGHMNLADRSRLEVGQNGLLHCLRGAFVYEPDTEQLEFPFPKRLASAGLRSVVFAPLLVESNVFGVLIAARRLSQSFSSTDCEFLRQLSGHVALASHQAGLHNALQQAYEDLRETQRTAMQQERLRALGQMASGIAHDINNAISPATLYIESMLESETTLSPSARGKLATIGKAIDDVADTVARMREFYRPREPQTGTGPVQLNEQIRQVVELTRAQWSGMEQRRSAMVEVVEDLSPDLPAITAMESEIRQALTNLVFNAIDAMPQGGTLTVRTRAVRLPDDKSGGQQVIVEVTDTGLGMDDETRRHCLEPFYTTKGERGTGLGLAMVYGIVQRNEGEIEIETAPGAGTTIRFVFRVSSSSIPGPVPETAAWYPAGLKILVVDDDPIILQALSSTLERDGHRVIAADGGQAGIDAFREAAEDPFSVVITDLGMPRIDGRKVASTLKGLSPTTPIILLTGWGQTLAADAIPPGVDRMLSKPPKWREVREALAWCCRGDNLIDGRGGV